LYDSGGLQVIELFDAHVCKELATLAASRLQCNILQVEITPFVINNLSSLITPRSRDISFFFSAFSQG
jgi:hypothetical protein